MKQKYNVKAIKGVKTEFKATIGIKSRECMPSSLFFIAI